MGFRFVTETDAEQFIESLKSAFQVLGSEEKEIIDVKFSTTAVPKPLEATLQEVNSDGLNTFDFITEYSALILWKD